MVRGTGVAVARFEVTDDAYTDVTLKLTDVNGGDADAKFGSLVGTALMPMVSP